uniref:ABC transporter B family member 8 n=1 Tax=Kalanchoe fedtschenkoi TaxID=63787 RepID=A0A7N0VKW2_KALFE
MKKERNCMWMLIMKYADWLDIVLMLLGSVGAIGDGMSTNVLLLFVSRLMNSLGYGQERQSRDGSSSFMDEVEKCSLDFVYIGLGIMAVAFLEGYCWSKSSERIVLKIRYKYLEALLRQEVGFFDSQEATTTSEIIHSISKDTSLLQELLSEKVPLFVMHSSSFLSGIAFSAYFSWRLALAAFPTILFLIVPGIMYGKYLMHLSTKSHKEHSKANTVVEQALSSIKTIYSFTAEQTILHKYSALLETTTELGIRQGIAKGLTIGSMGLSFAIWAYLAWYGGRLVMYGGESGGRIYAAAICFVMSGLSLGTALPELKYFTEADVAARGIIQRIDRVPRINAEENKGLVLDAIVGELHLDRVKFTYPSRPDSIVLNNFSLKVEAGQTVALVGASGCGKSTAIALVQRFYDADEGVVKIDGVDIKTVKLKWLRGKMGLVSQEHALFGTSIRENIKFGKLDATNDEITAAAMAANAHNFIMQLPQGYDTNVGERGALISGGQKQRIAIARAIVKNPVILLLDEATSALDSESESVVQKALDQAFIGRTTLIVAHKLSTVKNADIIAVMSDGSIIETGSHEDLINRKHGHYAKLAKLQRQFSCDIDDQEQPLQASRLTATKSSPSVWPTPSPELDHSAEVVTSSPRPSFTSLLALNRPEWKEGLIGSISAAAYGSIQPIYALTIGGMISAFFLQDHGEMQARIRTYSLIFTSLSFMSLILNLLQHYNFAYMGEQVTKRIRLRMLDKILSFEAAWFDEEHNSSGALCSRLSTEVSLLKSVVADRVSLIVQTTSSVTIAIILGLLVAWKLAAVMIAIQPLTIMCFYVRKVLLSSISSNFVKSQNRSTQMAMEAVCNHRIVTSFESREKVLELFEQAQDGARMQARKKAWLAGVGIGLAQGLTFLSWALDFWYGGRLVESGQISAGDVFKTFFILVSTGKVIAEAGSMTSDLAKGSAAVSSVFEILDRQSLIQVGNGDSKTENFPKMEGRIEIHNVHFAYPSRPETPVLRQFCLEVKAGQSVGLVGKSGCGKSTVIGLIQRFYDAEKGTVRVDGVDIKEINLRWYRMHMALVSQEPVIFSGSVRDNIAFGEVDASMNQVVEAARAANAHEFISSLKDGYETECGERGAQLSGGQKQRIAVARAMIRNPVILLLDEATSALDVQTEQVVQEALDRIMIGRTTVVVAHRLGTIKHMDSISYVADGKIVEQGTYADLYRNRGAFYNLANLQN